MDTGWFDCLCSAHFLHSQTTQDHRLGELRRPWWTESVNLKQSLINMLADQSSVTNPSLRLSSQVTQACVKLSIKANHHIRLINKSPRVLYFYCLFPYLLLSVGSDKMYSFILVLCLLYI